MSGEGVTGLLISFISLQIYKDIRIRKKVPKENQKVLNFDNNT